MARISISRNHRMSRARAAKIAAQIAAELSTKYGVRSRWEGNEMIFERQGLSGKLTFGVRDVLIQVDLGLLLSSFRDSIATAIEDQLDKALGGSPR